MKFNRLIGLGLIALMLGACGGADQEEATEAAPPAASDEISVTEAELAGNPFMEEWDTPYGVPPFSAIENGHYMPAMKKGVLDLRAEIDAIVSNAEAPTFENTIVALELAGELLGDVASTFGNITGTDTDDELRALETEIYPMLTREFDAITMNPDLWQRVKTVYEQRDSLGLDEQDARLLELFRRTCCSKRKHSRWS
jgi:peptidyl-dipeptidase Dcp